MRVSRRGFFQRAVAAPLLATAGAKAVPAMVGAGAALKGCRLRTITPDDFALIKIEGEGFYITDAIEKAVRDLGNDIDRQLREEAKGGPFDL